MNERELSSWNRIYHDRRDGRNIWETYCGYRCYLKTTHSDNVFHLIMCEYWREEVMDLERDVMVATTVGISPVSFHLGSTSGE